MTFAPPISLGGAFMESLLQINRQQIEDCLSLRQRPDRKMNDRKTSYFPVVHFPFSLPSRLDVRARRRDGKRRAPRFSPSRVFVSSGFRLHCIPSALTKNAHSSAASSIRLLVGVPPPWPARVVMRIR
jgi:hypothetical protein